MSTRHGQNRPDRSQRLVLDSFPHTWLGLPGRVRACLFDLDGVLTDTAKLYAAAWQQMFDGYLKARADATRTTFGAFDVVAVYDTYVDGKGRADGTRSFCSHAASTHRGVAPATEREYWRSPGSVMPRTRS